MTHRLISTMQYITSQLESERQRRSLYSNPTQARYSVRLA